MKTKLAALLSLVVIMSACSAGPATPGGPSGSPGGGGSTGGDLALARADVPRASADPAAATAAGAAIDAFGLDLLRAVAAGQPNAVFSPASIALALGMARAGARGVTAAEMDAVMHGLGSDEHAAWLNALDQALAARSGTFKDASGQDLPVALQHRQRALRPAGHAPRDGVPRRARVPLRCRPSPRRLRGRHRGGPQAHQRLGRWPDRASHPRAARCGCAHARHPPCAGERDLPEGALAGRVPRRRHEAGGVHAWRRLHGRGSDDGDDGSHALHVRNGLEGRRAPVHRRLAGDDGDRPRRLRSLRALAHG